MRPVLVIARAVVADAIRRKVVWMVIVFAGLLAIVAPSLPSYGVGVVDAVFREVAISLMYASSLVVTIALAATRVPGEVERRTVFGLLSRDVRRWQYLAGTWLGIFLVTGAVIAASTVVTIAIGGVVYGSLMTRLVMAAFAVWLEMGVVGAFGMALSTRVGAVTSSVGALVFVFVGHSISTLYTGGAANVSAPSYIPSLEMFDVVNAVSHGTGYSGVYALTMLTAFVAWVAILLLVATRVFQARDL